MEVELRFPMCNEAINKNERTEFKLLFNTFSKPMLKVEALLFNTGDGVKAETADKVNNRDIIEENMFDCNFKLILNIKIFRKMGKRICNSLESC